MWRLPHRHADTQCPQQVGFRVGVHVDSRAEKLECVDGAGGDEVADASGQGDGRHQRQDDRVLAGQLEHDHQGGDGGMAGAREDCGHPDEPVGAGRHAESGEPRLQHHAERCARHRADEQRGREDASRAADSDREAGREDLGDQQAEQERQCVATLHAVLHDGVADAVHLGQDQKYGAEQHPACGWTQPLGPAPEPIAQVLDELENPGERPAEKSGDEPEDRVSQVLQRRMDAEGG